MRTGVPKLLHVETGLLQFLDGRFSGCVRGKDGDDGIGLAHARRFICLLKRLL